MNDRILLTPWFLGRREPGMDRLARPGWRIVPAEAAGDDERGRMVAVHDAARDAVAAAVAAGERPVSISADCCTTIGVAAGLQRAGLDPVLVWFDAHGDFNTWETTRSGFIGGMPLAMLVGRGEQSLLASAGARRLAESDVILADARDLDPAEADLLAGSSVHHVSDVGGVPAAIPAGRPIWVHFDVDVLNPDDAPAMRYRTPGGPRLAEFRRCAEAIAGTGRVAAVSMDIWDTEPANDAGGRTEAACMRALESLLGR